MIKDDLIKIRSKILPANQFKLITLSILIILLFANPILHLVHFWYNNPDYSHGFVVIPTSLFILWQKREDILSTSAKASWAGFPLLLAGSIGYLIAVITKFQTLTYLSMVVTLLSLLLFLVGYKLTRILLFPVLFLLFMFPIPSEIYILIENLAKLMITDISVQIIRFFKIAVYQEGNLLFLANTSLEITEACSGIRSLYSFLMLGVVLTILCKKKMTKIILVCSTIPLAIFMNIIRVTGTGVLSNYYGDEVAQGFFHQFAGFLVFAIGFVLLSFEYYLLEGKIFTKQS